MALLGGPGLGEAGLEGGGEVDDRGPRRSLGLEHGGAPGGLLLDDLLDARPVLVGVLLGLEVVAERFDEALGHLQLLVGDLHAFQLLELLDRGRLDQLVREHERRQREVGAVGPDRCQILLLAHHEPADADTAGAGHRVRQQGVGLGVLVRQDEVRRIEHQRVDVDLRHERLEVDLLRLHRLQRGEIVVGERDVTAATEVVALDDVLGRAPPRRSPR